jgi:hypothetical protein
MSEKYSEIIQETQDWVVKAVIGLNLCPFAKAVHVKEQIKYVKRINCRSTTLIWPIILKIKY